MKKMSSKIGSPKSAKRSSAEPTTTPKRPAPIVPADWDAETSVRHWFPQDAAREQLRTLAIAAGRTKSPAEQKRAWAKVAALFPPTLNKLIGKTPWRWGSIPSPDVADVAMQLIACAATSTSSSEIETVESELERILPELPALCLPEVVGERPYEQAWAAINDAIVRRTNDELSIALQNFRTYLSTT